MSTGSDSNTEMTEETKIVKSDQPKEKAVNQEIKKIKSQLNVPIVLMIIAMLMILVAAVFISITYYQAMKAKSLIGDKLGSSVHTYLLAALIIIWIGFIFSVILLGVSYYSFSGIDPKNNELSKEKVMKSSTMIWISVFVTAILVFIVGLISLYLCFKFRPFNNVLFTNILVATVTSIGGFLFIIFAALYYANSAGKFKELYEYSKESVNKELKRRKEESTKRKKERLNKLRKELEEEKTE